MKKVSVIVPLFNAISTVDKCVDSILKQTYEDLEVILVDDGSIDDTYAHCCQNFNKDKRVKIFKNDGKGVSAARNFGLTKADGEYVVFVDSDDHIEETMLVHAVHQMECGADLTLWGYVFETETDALEHLIDEECECVTLEFFAEHFFIKLLSNYVINNIGTKMYRKSIIDINDIRFSKENICEDIGFAIAYLANVKTISYINKCFYHYVNNSKGLMHKVKPNFISARRELLVQIDSFVKNKVNIDLYQYNAYKFKSIRALFLDSFLYSTDKYFEYESIMSDDYYRNFMLQYRKNKLSLKDKLFCLLFLHKKKNLIDFLIKLYVRKDHKAC